MLRTRLWMGTILVGVAGLLLAEDRWFAPYFPILFICYTLAALFGVREFRSLLPSGIRPREPLVSGIIVAMALSHWFVAISEWKIDIWHLVGICFLIGVIAAFLVEMWCFRDPNQITIRIALTTLIIFYLGVLPSFLAQLRWLGDHSTVVIALAVFVPKCNDIGAYFTGKFLTGKLLGRTPMTPRLSPKKTWQGATGGMMASVLVAVLVNQTWSTIPGGLLGSIGFGLSVGLAGILGDLAESLIKRDLQTKDASQSIPGFGGVLDVIDSLLFAGPVAYLWMARS